MLKWQSMASYDQTLPVTDVKRDLLTLVQKLKQYQQSIAITKNGKPTAVLIDIDEYEGLLETIEILSDPKLVKILKQAQSALNQGHSLSHKEVWGEDS